MVASCLPLSLYNTYTIVKTWVLEVSQCSLHTFYMFFCFFSIWPLHYINVLHSRAQCVLHSVYVASANCITCGTLREIFCPWSAGMVGYGMAKAAVHQLCQSLAAKNSGMPSGAAAVAILPWVLPWNVVNTLMFIMFGQRGDAHQSQLETYWITSPLKISLWASKTLHLQASAMALY